MSRRAAVCPASWSKPPGTQLRAPAEACVAHAGEEAFAAQPGDGHPRWPLHERDPASAVGTRCGLDFFGADHALFGTDCPFDPEGGPLYIRETIRVIDALDLTDTARDRIHHHNVRRLMRMPDAQA
ncbi:amidohydrolase family protein [Streptomyces sp. NPDC088360]|uniref:amidohydrolase family protein n=1 Tax=Streptomyces sp. NPDC088360 TaxID=3154515 RepID=UPI00344C2963